MGKYVLSIDQSTQGTKALLFDHIGKLKGRSDLLHKQYVNEFGWVEHDPEEIYNNVLSTVKNLVQQTGVNRNDIAVLGISNQRETVVVWERETGKPVYNAIVWQCARATEICNKISSSGYSDLIQSRTGIRLSPYFSAAKIAWILQNIDEKVKKKELCCGTIDSWLIFKLTGGKEFRTDYSNASRTQLLNIHTLAWDEEICKIFDIPISYLPEITDSDGEFGMTDFGGYLEQPILIHGVLGDSHGALFGQGCIEKGMIKTTYGTGSSIMMNIGEKPISSKNVVTSLAWKLNGKIQYVLEGNINYTGAVVSWLKDNLQLINTSFETEEMAMKANRDDKTYFIPAFTGLGAPYWNNYATATLTGMTRITGKNEIVRAGLESIAYQILDILKIMQQEVGEELQEICVDGGPTKNMYLMQFQSDISNLNILVPSEEELSGMGAAYVSGIAIGLYKMENLFAKMERKRFMPNMSEEKRKEKYEGWKTAVEQVLKIG